jgi:cell division septal protein FtsQ
VGPGVKTRPLVKYVPTIFKLAVAVIAGIVIFGVYRTVASASFFQLRTVEVQGASRASKEDVQAAVRHGVGKAGVWAADLKELSASLERLPWVRRALVSRVLPDSIRVRIQERVPRVVARISSGRLRWVDEDAILLGEMLPADQMPAFFLRGLSEETSEAARQENVQRIGKFLELEREWSAAGLAERVSEVNLFDLRDVRAQLAGDDSQIEVRLGAQDPTKRLKQALTVLDEQRQTPRGQFISYVDLSLGRRAIIGFVSGAHAVSDTVGVKTTGASDKINTDGVSRTNERSPRDTPKRQEEKGRKDRKEKVRRAEYRMKTPPIVALNEMVPIKEQS